jgi:hypothetical protein
MTLLTWEEEEILHKVRELDHKVDQLFALVQEILHEVGPPKFYPPIAITVVPAKFNNSPTLIPVRR